MKHSILTFKCKSKSCIHKLTLIGDAATVSENNGKRCALCGKNYMELTDKEEPQDQEGPIR